MASQIKAIVTEDGKLVRVEDGFRTLFLTPQEAYDMHQALGAILSQCVQPFEPYPRE